jgi:anti-sigma factor (TIGR02949 family)
MNRDTSRCDHVRDLLAELIYGELDTSSEREVRRHIEDCPECRQELADLERVRAVMRSSTELELPAGLEARVMSEARQALPEAETAPPESEPSGLRALLSRLLASPAFRPALAASLTALLIAGIAWMLVERRGSVIERHVEKRTKEPLPSFEAPAAPPEEEVEQEGITTPPPYPTPAAAESTQARADGPVTAPVAGDGAKHDKEAPRSETEKDSSPPHDLLTSVATGKTKAGEKSPPPVAKKMPGTKLAGIAADEDGGMVAGGAEGGAGASTLGGYGTGTKAGPPAEEHATLDATLGKSAPKKPATPSPTPAPASPPPPEPSTGAAPPPPTYASPAADMEDDELLEAEESKPEKSAGSSGKKSWKQKWADYKAKKKAAKEAKKAKKAKNKGAKAESVPGAAAQAAADAAQDPFDAAMSKKKDKDYKGCVSILSALKKSPSSTGKSAARVHHQLAWCTAAAGDAKKALVLYENLLAKHPSYAGRHQAMMEAADLYAKLGDKKGARALLEKLLDVPKYEKKAKKKLEKLK